MDKKGLALLSLCCFSVLALADSCPTQLIKNHEGFWVSQQAPGWKSSEHTSQNTIINTNDFGGALYSPKDKRVACVFRTSQGYWVALVSHVHKGLQIDRHMLDDAHQHRAWKWDPKHKDFVCGRPTVSKVKNCKFTINS